MKTSTSFSIYDILSMILLGFLFLCTGLLILLTIGEEAGPSNETWTSTEIQAEMFPSSVSPSKDMSTTSTDTGNINNTTNTNTTYTSNTSSLAGGSSSIPDKHNCSAQKVISLRGHSPTRGRFAVDIACPSFVQELHQATQSMEDFAKLQTPTVDTTAKYFKDISFWAIRKYGGIVLDKQIAVIQAETDNPNMSQTMMKDLLYKRYPHLKHHIQNKDFTIRYQTKDKS